ncbi:MULTISPECIES: hypothetical protein [unclassified Lentimicrobium]|uniref:hypothetical protein n=1 Tax=unclassified Lentimicrobium TaxID=2677434 RepID=UPI0015536698|nr:MULTISPECIES: hypothetical protein [unclassified Lentimicrobium]NPD45259.1 hypothetical protein [Lentimicrobium sp. S6]NPD86209.1 hypothetical protein [Lentimicrobium sp. L6]
MSGFSMPPTKWVFRKKPNEMYSTKRTTNVGIENEHREFKPQPKLKWFKSSLQPFFFFLLIASIGLVIGLYYFSRKDEMISRTINQKEKLRNQIYENTNYLLDNAEYLYASGDFVSAKKDLDLVLKSNPQSVKANRLYIQTIIQLVGKYPSYKEEAIQKTKGCLQYLTDSENDEKLLLTYHQIILEKY